MLSIPRKKKKFKVATPIIVKVNFATIENSTTGQTIEHKLRWAIIAKPKSKHHAWIQTSCFNFDEKFNPSHKSRQPQLSQGDNKVDEKKTWQMELLLLEEDDKVDDGSIDETLIRRRQ